MSLLANQTTPQKMPGKRIFDKGGFNKHQKVDSVRRFPANCSAPVSNIPPSNNTKCRKVEAVRDFPFAAVNNGGENERSNSKVENTSSREGLKHVLTIPSLPLRSTPTVILKREPKNYVKSPCIVDVVGGGKTANDDEIKVCSFEESRKRNSDKVAALIVEAKEFIKTFDVRKECTSIVAAKSEKRARENPCAESLTLMDLDQSLREKRIKVECEDDEDEVCVLSPAKWNSLQYGSKNGPNTSSGDIETNQEVVSDPQATKTKCGEKHEEPVYMDNMDECASYGEKEEDESSEIFAIDDHYSIVLYSDITSKEVFIGGHSVTTYYEDEDVINMSIVKHDQPQGLEVKEALKLFELQYAELLQAEMRGERKVTYAHLEAARILKGKGMWIEVEKHFGHIPGVEIGDEFRFRVELAVVGIHRQLISGIDYVFHKGRKVATSVVNSGRYDNEAKALDVLIYSGQGGNPDFYDNALDQKLEKGNLALVNSMEMGYPIRVTYKRKIAMANDRNYVYVYDGLYMVNRYWQERDQKGKLVFKFELQRMPDQPRPRQNINKSRKSKTFTDVCVMEDVSQGREKLPIRAMNGVDCERPPSFTYDTNIDYPYWFRLINPVGCDCVNGCSDSEPCSCVLKNGGEIPFNENGDILRAKPMVHECGPLCKCPPSCMNRVSQNGPRYKLEIFKTRSRGWGVRSRSYISSGSFICEYVGKLLRDKEAETRVGADEYLFDICDSQDEGKAGGFAIDAAIYGNVGRFINHSCSPNLYAQEVLYDHDDKRMPHIMFFATKNIPPMQELSYDYNYKMDRICDANGNIKTKACYCGSRKCTGRMY